METKQQTYEVYFETSDEEIDGPSWIETAIEEYVKKHNKKHIERIGVTEMRNEWGNHRDDGNDD